MSTYLRLLMICACVLPAQANGQTQHLVGTYELDRDEAERRIHAKADSFIVLLTEMNSDETEANIAELKELKASARANLDAMIFAAQLNSDSTFNMQMSPPTQPSIPMRGKWRADHNAEVLTLILYEINQQTLPEPEVLQVPYHSDRLYLNGFISIDLVLKRKE